MKDDSSIRGELLDLLPVVGHRFGLRHAALDHLMWLIRRTRVMDWRPGNRAVVYKSVSETAAERGISSRQVNSYEREIVAAFGCSVSCSHCRRYGQRDKESGRIVLASGFELTNLHNVLSEMRQAKADLDAQHERRRQRKRELTMAKGVVRRLANAVLVVGNGDQIETARGIATRINVRLSESDAAVIQVLEARILDATNAARELEVLLLAGKTCGSDVRTSDMSEENFRHIHPSLDPRSTLKGGCSPHGDIAARKPAGVAREGRPAGLSCKEGGSVGDYDGPAFAPSVATGADRVRTRIAIKAASERFRAHLPSSSRRPTDDDVVDAARGVASELGINDAAWREACEIVGTYPAALCVLITDHAEAERGVASPSGYFRAMVRRAPLGGLAIDRSVLGMANK